MESARTFSQKKFTSPVHKGSALFPRLDGRGKLFLLWLLFRRISTDLSILSKKKSPKALCRNAWKALSREKNCGSQMSFGATCWSYILKPERTTTKTVRNELSKQGTIQFVHEEIAISSSMFNKNCEKCETGTSGGAEFHAVVGGESSYNVLT